MAVVLLYNSAVNDYFLGRIFFICLSSLYLQIWLGLPCAIYQFNRPHLMIYDHLVVSFLYRATVGPLGLKGQCYGPKFRGGSGGLYMSKKRNNFTAKT